MLAPMDDREAPTRSLRDPDFLVPRSDRYLEDYQLGAVHEYGYLTVTAEEIVGFARRFDPQTIHTDPAFAATGPFGGLIASGWHSAGLLMRLYADHYLSTVASLGSPGIDELRWPAPLRPGDAVRLRTTIMESRPSRSKPDRGLLWTRAELLAGPDRAVMTCLAINMLLRRPDPAPDLP
jgi:acyl dehydratase